MRSRAFVSLSATRRAGSTEQGAQSPSRLMLRIALVALIVVAVVVDGQSHNTVRADDQRPPYGCNSFPTVWGFWRWKASLWNWCATDSYGPPEWLYWNYYPSTRGYNNPGSGPYYSSVAEGVARWASAQPNWKFTYQSGDWSAGTDSVLVRESSDTFRIGFVPVRQVAARGFTTLVATTT